MAEATQQRGAGTRVRWNDIRIVGPLLVMALMTAALVSPQFAGADQSVGSLVGPCYDYGYETAEVGRASATGSAAAVSELVGPCCSPRFALATAGSAAFPLLSDDCCRDGGGLSSVVGGGALEICPPPAPPGPAVKLRPPPDPIIGPIWLGATQPSVVNGSIVLTPPVVLGLFIENNFITVTNSDDLVVYQGRLGANGSIMLSAGSVGGSGDYTMVTRVKTGAKYTEVISVDTTTVN